MRKSFLLWIAVILLSCTENPKGFDSKIFTEKQVSDFIRLNPNWTENEATEAQTTEKFKHKMINLSNEPKFLDDLPLQLTAILDTTVSDQAVKLAVFKAFKDAARPKESLLNDLNLEIRGIMSLDQVKGLAIGKKYTIKGMVFKQGKRADVNFVHDANHKTYALGKYTFWNITVQPL